MESLQRAHEALCRFEHRADRAGRPSQEPRAGFPLTFELNRGKLPSRSWAKISQIRTLSVKRLGKKIGTASVEELEQVIEGLNEIVGA